MHEQEDKKNHRIRFFAIEIFYQVMKDYGFNQGLLLPFKAFAIDPQVTLANNNVVTIYRTDDTHMMLHKRSPVAHVYLQLSSPVSAEVSIPDLQECIKPGASLESYRNLLDEDEYFKETDKYVELTELDQLWANYKDMPISDRVIQNSRHVRQSRKPKVIRALP